MRYKTNFQRKLIFTTRLSKESSFFCQFYGMMAAQPSLVNSFLDDSWIYQQINNKNFYVDDNVIKLSNKPWSVFASTPIANFKLEKFQENLSNTLTLQGIEFSKCSVSLVPEFVVSEKDDPAIKIELIRSASRKEGNSSSKETRIYEGLFISRASDYERRGNFINLPVLICKGSFKVVKSVNTAMEKIFDNSISPYNFSHNELLFLGLLSSLNTNIEAGDDINLKYDFPDISNSSASYQIHLKSFVQLWKSICRSDELVAGNSALSSFYQNLLIDFRRIYGIDLSFFRLKDVLVSKQCVIKSRGTVRTQVPEVMDFLLRYLTKHINSENQV